MRLWLLSVAQLAALPAPLSAAAPAQDMGWSTIIPSVAGTDTLGLALRRNAEENQRPAPRRTTAPVRRAEAPIGSPEAALPSPAAAASLRFTPSAARRKVNYDRFLAARRGQSDAATHRQLAGMLADPQFVPNLERELGRLGLRSDDIGDAYTIWWIQAWLAAQGSNRDATPAEIRAVKAQTARVILATPQIAGSDDATKQEFADSLLVQTVIMGSVISQVQGNPDEVRQVGTIARGIARANNVDLDAFTLTDQGFVPR